MSVKTISNASHFCGTANCSNNNTKKTQEAQKNYNSIIRDNNFKGLTLAPCTVAEDVSPIFAATGAVGTAGAMGILVCSLKSLIKNVKTAGTFAVIA